MKTRQIWRSCLAILLFLSVFRQQARAQIDPEPPLPTPLDSWSFSDNVGWTDDNGNPPISFTNIASSDLGYGSSLAMETNVPAWLNYPIYETSGATNIVVNGSGSICLWYAGGWATTNGGPGNPAQLVEAGESDSSIGYFGLSIDSVGSNLWFASQDGAGDTYSLSAPISWTTNYFHFVTLTYSATNVSLYLDGQLATNDSGGLSIWPASAVIPNGVYFGSDTNGNSLADGLFNWVQTFGTVLDSNTVAEMYDQEIIYYEITPWNIPYMSALNSATSSPSYTPTYEAITGLGNLLWLSNVDNCVSASEYDVWITNVTASVVRNGTNLSMNMAFTIQGGSDVPYDVFANSQLHGGTNGMAWAWMGQAYPCGRFMLTNLPPRDCFLILGTPYTSNPGLGLSDAYELLVLQISPGGPQYDSYGVPYAWYAQHGLTSLTNGLATADPDQDAILNYQEYLYGTDPQVSEGFGVWVSTPNGTSGVP
jgi:hypothetical protein